MAKFRKSHEGKRKGDSWFGRVVMFTILLIFALVGSFIYFPNLINGSSQNDDRPEIIDESGNSISVYHRDFLPVSENKDIIHHAHYSLAYNDDKEQADWVSYELTKKSIQAKNVPRAKRFNMDPKVKTKSAKHSDYSHSGFTRGHLAPAGDMAFSSDAMRESFYMSNMSPQPRTFNNGIWKELEEQVRDWAYKKDAIYVATGPIFYDNRYEKIGSSKVAVPDAFYKILVEKSSNKNIAFIIPNQLSNKHLYDYQVSIDEVEDQTGIDFFPEVLDENEESGKNKNGWPISDSRYNSRVNKWNKE